MAGADDDARIHRGQRRFVLERRACNNEVKVEPREPGKVRRLAR